MIWHLHAFMHSIIKIHLYGIASSYIIFPSSLINKRFNPILFYESNRVIKSGSYLEHISSFWMNLWKSKSLNFLRFNLLMFQFSQISWIHPYGPNCLNFLGFRLLHLPWINPIFNIFSSVLNPTSSTFLGMSIILLTLFQIHPLLEIITFSSSIKIHHPLSNFLTQTLQNLDQWGELAHSKK